MPHDLITLSEQFPGLTVSVSLQDLLSRFMFFCINSTPQWLDGFESYCGDEPLEDTFDAIGAEFTAFTKELEALPQIGKFNDFFAAE